MKKVILFSVLVSGLVLAGSATALAIRSPHNLNTSGTGRILMLPAEAENSHVISLGEAVDPGTGLVVEGLMFIHGNRTNAKGGIKGPPSGNSDTESSCFAFLGNGAKWKETESYLIDPTNSEGISVATIEALVASGLNAWDTEVATDIFGAQVAGVVDGADSSAPDGKNEVLFANISGSGTIGVTTVWGVFKGKPANRQLVEWDMVLDDTDFDWSAETDGVLGKMDFSNIFVHEAGHALGLGHPGDGCVDETMFRFASKEEIKKRDLADGDVVGVQELYN